MKKTIREHLNDLPEPYRTEALENESKGANCDGIEEDTISDALMCAFLWSSTPQGFYYWSDFYETL